ncbi:hypothetical protein FHT76_005745 [Rhizobium sp. BK176]|nr:hypothetical protein [Rhizobium sp. BK181]MCS4094045.1 hypothetical protein [Rhizobium sp. BK176]
MVEGAGELEAKLGEIGGLTEELQREIAVLV